MPAAPHALPETLGEVVVPRQICVCQDWSVPQVGGKSNLIRFHDLGPGPTADAAVAECGSAAVVDDATSRHDPFSICIPGFRQVEGFPREEPPGVFLDLVDLVEVEHRAVFGAQPVLRVVVYFVLVVALTVVAGGPVDAGAGLAEDESAFVELSCDVAGAVGVFGAGSAYEVGLDASLEVGRQDGGIRTRFEDMARYSRVSTEFIGQSWGMEFGDGGTVDWVKEPEFAGVAVDGHGSGVGPDIGCGGIRVELWEGSSECTAGVADGQVGADCRVRPEQTTWDSVSCECI